VWEPQPDTARDKWRGTPRARKSIDRAPITIEPEMTMWAKILGFRTDQFYQDPLVYLKNQLKINIFRHENFDDDTCVGREITIWLGVSLESSLFGSRTVYQENEYPWIDREPVIRDHADLERIPPFDFHATGLMPLCHRFFETISEIVTPAFKVTFPEWGRSIFGVATHIRGFENVLMDMMSAPEFVHRLMRRITDTRKQWVRARADFLGQRVEKGNLYNDEVNCPSLSRELYEEFVLPYEKELSEYHGGILYWHSCGDTTELLPSISRIPNLQMFHVGPWTDVRKAAEVFDGRVALEICLHPVRDVQNATKAEMEDRLKGIARACVNSRFTVRADGLQVMTSVEEDLKKIQEWNGFARHLL
jgi:uroporphyrinogen-III decarboxylase